MVVVEVVEEVEVEFEELVGAGGGGESFVYS